jgi:hypothetical protein
MEYLTAKYGELYDLAQYRLENDPRFLGRVAQARASLRAGGGVRLEDIEPKQ